MLLQVVVTNNDINLQGDSLSHFLSKYFVHPDMKLLPDKYWQDAEYHGFVMNLKVS